MCASVAMNNAKRSTAVLIILLTILMCSCLLTKASTTTSYNETSETLQDTSERDPVVFSKIIDRLLPANILYEDNLCIAIDDINPKTPVHFLVIPKNPVPLLSATKEQDQMLLGHLLLVANKVALQRNIGNGYRIVINNKPDTIRHLHVHVLGGQSLRWRPGYGHIGKIRLTKGYV